MREKLTSERRRPTERTMSNLKSWIALVGVAVLTSGCPIPDLPRPKRDSTSLEDDSGVVSEMETSGISVPPGWEVSDKATPQEWENSDSPDRGPNW